MEGYGILQVRDAFPIPLYTEEAVYEDREGRVVHPVTQALDAYGITSEITGAPRYYYRRYFISDLLSGGVGMAYGMSGVSPTYGNRQRYTVGLPDGGNAVGYRDLPRIEAFFKKHHWNANQVVPLDPHIVNTKSTPSDDPLSPDLGLNRAKLCRLGDTKCWFAYNPYPTDLEVRDVPPGLPIEVWIPSTGVSYSAGLTSPEGRIPKPAEANQDYLLVIGE